MTISSEVATETANGNGAATVFPFPFTILDPGDGNNDHLKVTIINTVGDRTTLSQGTGTANYSVQITGEYPSNGSIIYPASGASFLLTGEQLVIERDVPLTQELDLENQGPYFAELQEEGFDKLTMIAQQIQNAVDNIPGASGGSFVTSVVGQTGAITASQIKTDIDSEPNTNFLTDTERTKLAGIQDGAQTNPGNATIKSQYEANSDTNVFTDAEKTKLSGVETGSTADQTGQEIVNSINAELGNTTWQGGGGGGGGGAVDSVVGLTGDVSAAQIKSGLEGEANTNFLTDAEQTKLAGIEASATADQTDTEIVTAINTELGNTDWQTGGSGSVPSQEADDLNTLSSSDIDGGDLELLYDTSADEIKTVGFNAKNDLNISAPGANFTIGSSNRAGTIFTPTGGSIATVNTMRVGQIVSVINLSGGTYTFSAGGGITLVGTTSVANNKEASLLAVNANTVHIIVEP